MAEQTFTVGQWVRCKTWYDPAEVGTISAVEQGEAHAYLIVYEDGEYINARADELTPADPPPAQPDDAKGAK